MKLGIKMILVLVVVSLGAAALLGLVFGVTAPVIAEQKEKARKEALGELIPDADTFVARTVVEEADSNVIYLAYKNGQKIGLVFTVSPRGYAGPIETMVGVKKDSSISSIRIASAAEGLKETPGLGARVLEDWFRDQFKGLKQQDVNLKKDGGKVDAITAATISSNAVTSGIRRGLGRYIQYLGEGEEEGEPSDSTSSRSGNPADTTARRELVKKVITQKGYVDPEFLVVVYFDDSNRIARVQIPEKSFEETADAIKCCEDNFLNRFVGIARAEDVAKVEAVTGASRTSDSIKVAVAKAFGK